METQSYTCMFVLCGPPNERWEDYLGDLAIEVLVEKGKILTTTLTGHPADLAAFLGTLRSIHDLGLNLTRAEFALVAAEKNETKDDYGSIAPN